MCQTIYVCFLRLVMNKIKDRLLCYAFILCTNDSSKTPSSQFYKELTGIKSIKPEDILIQNERFTKMFMVW